MIENKILALKYRPQEFKDLIGQDVVAKTITNAIKIGKTPNAYLLTGIRGIGKTTTARLIAKELNCVKSSDSSKKCSPKDFCSSCKEIINTNHIDVLEMDAASKTGIDDVRELIENARYSPTNANYKIFIIDEVHMLSKQAFNGLLKTLEEPPKRLKFILATTEVRKIPVTILSRCQRFDLKRVSLEKMLNHLKNITKKEEGKVSEDALKIIAKASEGSVRDAISLLDKALVSQSLENDKEIDVDKVREMLGIADRSRILNLFKEILKGDAEKSINELREMINEGLDVKNFLNDILEILYLFSRKINLGDIVNDMMVSDSEIKTISEYSKNLDIDDLGLFWQLTLKTIDDLKIVNNENLALEMYVMQLIHLKKIRTSDNHYIQKNLDSEKEILIKNEIDLGSKTITTTKDQLKNTEQIKSTFIKNPKLEKKDLRSFEIKSLDDLINKAHKEREVELKYDLERNVNLVSFQKGKIEISLNEKLNKNFIKTLTEKLYSWTGQRWLISLTKKSGAQTLYESKKNEEMKNIKREENSELSKKVTSSFPDAKLIKVEEKDDS
mgnify:FL=1